MSNIDLEALVHGPNLLAEFSDEIPRSRRKKEKVRTEKPRRKVDRRPMREAAEKPRQQKVKRQDVNILVQKALLERMRLIEESLVRVEARLSVLTESSYYEEDSDTSDLDSSSALIDLMFEDNPQMREEAMRCSNATSFSDIMRVDSEFEDEEV